MPPTISCPGWQLWAGPPLMNINDGIRSEFQAQLQEHTEIVDLPVDRLWDSSDSHDMILEVSQAFGCLHVPIAPPNPDAPRLRHAIRDKALELIAPPLPVLRHRPGEIADLVTYSQPMGIRAIEPDFRQPCGFGAEAEPADLEHAIDPEPHGVPVVVLVITLT